ncbi:cobalt transport protein [Rhodospirillum rubrum F11]|uniref:Cobalt transport protein n=1 Tax=Rhodospirillum rubrum (strain ATCC 11170 / ATH 1.1.1 / DSM 467 / LMG 4362 / NCIMB 8255 / S1) TaxID=269796 RepID=Q2RUR2_RHORT|nr:energy-coupling factor transporter transmembrane protein EcfT [Rhodospirillum rubrum]ABC22133.1 Cobalt transport protein [Rhodospirillum rubrum ATCC 11170]AEO47848.1 cobalt transport protein [Rhodospirillum rubrum F11]MBK5953722.1 energy-coupling factor transporter transmembrane protein EcfT [Rhodospirillum rubrum]QXG81782.1 energy-coupling factor transporter transmembrane protein EcfT [Rhodospirillum rubrum]
MSRRPPRLALSPLHRLPAGVKLGCLAVTASALLLVEDWRGIMAALVATALLYRLGRLSWRALLGQLRPLLWLLLPLFVVQGLGGSWAEGGVVVLRIATLVLLAALVTLTTRTDAMIETIERGLAPFARFGVDPAKVGLAFSLALRFIPVIGSQSAEIRDAQRARGLGRNPLALALPLIVRTLKMANDVADAIDARSTDGEDDEALPVARRSPPSDILPTRLPCADIAPPPRTSFTSPCSPR